MKILRFLFLFTYSTITYSQNSNFNFRDSIDATFTTLNQDSITTGILLDKCLPQFDITKYEAINDTLTDFKAWRGIYRSMYLGAFNRSSFISDDSISHILQASREVDVIPIFILNYEYNSFKSYGVDSYLARINNFAFIKFSYI